MRKDCIHKNAGNVHARGHHFGRWTAYESVLKANSGRRKACLILLSQQRAQAGAGEKHFLDQSDDDGGRLSALFLSLTRRFLADSPGARLWESDCILALSSDGSFLLVVCSKFGRGILYVDITMVECSPIPEQEQCLHIACVHTYKQERWTPFTRCPYHHSLRKCNPKFLLHRLPCLLQQTGTPTSPNLCDSSCPSPRLFCSRQSMFWTIT